MKFSKSFIIMCVVTMMLVPAAAFAAKERYIIDTENHHAFIEFKISHLGFSWLYGTFKKFEGEFIFDTKDITKSTVFINIDPASVDTNFALRNKHIRGEGLLEVKKYPESGFKSKSIKAAGGGMFIITGDFTLHGVTKEIDITAKEVGRGKDPWEGYRMGFEGKTKLKLSDFGLTRDLGPFSKEVEITLSIEGIRQK